MIKRILLTFMALLAIYSIAMISYRIYEPKDTEDISDQVNGISYNSLREYTLSSGDSSRHYYFFYSSLDNNSIYINDTVLHTVAKDTGIDVHALIETVDITILQRNMSTNRITAEWGIHNFPAFLAVSVDNNTITIENVLEWSDDNAINATMIEQWMYQNGLIKS